MTQLALIPDDDAALELRHDPIEQSAEWLKTRDKGKISRDLFTQAIKDALSQTENPPPRGVAYAEATDAVYKGLCSYTARKLKEALGLPLRANLRDHLSQPALAAIDLVESTSAKEMLARYEELTYEICLQIIDEIARVVGETVKKLSVRIGEDIFTGRRLSGAPQLEG